MRTEVGFLFQGSALYDSMTIRENLEFPLRRHTKKFGIIEDTTPKVMEALGNVGLANTINLMPSELSGGMKRRINLIGGILHEPQVLLLDEPTVGMDVQTRTSIREHLQDLNRKKKTTIIYTSHNLDQAELFCNRVGIIDKGQLLCIDSPQELMRKENCNDLEEVFLKLTGRKIRD